MTITEKLDLAIKLKDNMALNFAFVLASQEFYLDLLV